MRSLVMWLNGVKRSLQNIKKNEWGCLRITLAIKFEDGTHWSKRFLPCHSTSCDSLFIHWNLNMIPKAFPKLPWRNNLYLFLVINIHPAKALGQHWKHQYPLKPIGIHFFFYFSYQKTLFLRLSFLLVQSPKKEYTIEAIKISRQLLSKRLSAFEIKLFGRTES